MIASTDLLAGRYRLRELLGAGGQASVWLGRDERSGIAVAVKEVGVERGAELRRELAILGRLRHPNLVEVLDLVETADGPTYLVQRHAPGVDLARWSARDRAPARVCAALAAVVRALAFLHRRGVIHRDLKPENILVDEREVAGLPGARLIDFGLALDRAEAVSVDGAAGTLGYLAPEVLAGERASPASDRYGLGVVLFESLLGRLPQRELGRLLEPGLEAAVGELLASLLRGLLDPSPAIRPALDAVTEVLGLAVGRSLLPTTDDLRGELRPEPPLLGRERASARIARALEAARGGQVTWLQLAGCGKSTVARAACLAARAAGAKVLAASHLSHLLPPAARAEDLAHRRSRMIDDLLDDRARPFLLCLDPGELDDQMLALYEELGRALEEGASRGGVVLHAGELPDGLAGGWETLLLPPLDRATSETLVREMLAGIERPFWIDQVFSTTGGDPRLIVELVHAQIAAGLPEQLCAFEDRSGLVERRVRELAAPEQEALAVIASTIHPLPFAILEGIVAEATGSIESLIGSGLATLEEGGLAPAHRLAAEAARRVGPQGEALQRLHARLSDAVREHAPSALDWIGHHLLLAGETRDAASLLARASGARLEDLLRVADELDPTDPSWPELLRALGWRQRSRGEQDAALATATRLGARHPEEGALLAAELLLAAGQPARALETLASRGASGAEAELRTEGVALRARVGLLEGRACIFLGRHQDAAAHADEVRRLPGLGRLLEAQAEGLAGLAAIYLGEPRSGLAALDRSAALAEAEGDQETLLRSESARGIALQRLGRDTEAFDAHRRCEALARELGDLRSAASACLNLGTLAHQRLELEEGYRQYQRAAELAHRASVGTTRAAAISNQANLLLLFGAFSEADRRLQQAEAIARGVGALSELGYLALYGGELRLLADDLEGAGAALDSARARFGLADASGRDAADLLAGELCARRGRAEDAAAIATELSRRISWEGPERFRVSLLAARAELARLAPDLELARRELELALALAERAGVGPLAWEAAALLARCCADLGRAEGAAHHAAGFEARVREFRERVPLRYRPDFDARPDLRRARAGMEGLASPPRRDGPSSEDLERLLAINEELNQGLPLELLLGRILDCAIELTGAERGFVLLEEEPGLRLAAARNLDRESVRRGMEKLSKSIAWLAIQEDRPLLCEDAMQDARFMDRCSISGLRLRAVLCAPFRVRERGRGALYVDNRFRTDVFTPRHLALMQSFAGQAGIAITHAQLIEELSHQARELAEAKLEVEGLNRELEAKLEAQREELGEISVRLRAHEEELVRKYNAARIVGRSKAMRELFANLERVAEAEVPILIWGESGTGKELVARAIHAHGPRCAHPFVSLNCGAIAASLLESELFGHARGAFTGATRDRPGLFEAAGAGTLLLDEVGDMPAEMQVKLLRILQEGSFRRVGEERERRSECRVLSASHKRLDELVARGDFREDLFYRLQVIQLVVPALRDRREDIPLLCAHILSALRPGLTVAPEAIAALLDYEWPGNVRQLENELQRAALLCEGVIEPVHLSIPTRRRRVRRPAGGLREELRRVEKGMIEAALRDAGGGVSEAAQVLGLHRVVLYRRMRELGVPTPASTPGRARKK